MLFIYLYVVLAEKIIAIEILIDSLLSQKLSKVDLNAISAFIHHIHKWRTRRKKKKPKTKTKTKKWSSEALLANLQSVNDI